MHQYLREQPSFEHDGNSDQEEFSANSEPSFESERYTLASAAAKARVNIHLASDTPEPILPAQPPAAPDLAAPRLAPGTLPVATGQARNKMVALFLALMFGSLGIHHFYLGKSGRGILYLLFAWTFVPFVLAYVDAIRLLLQSEEEFAQKYP